MPEDFQFDVFLSHSAKDKPVVRELAARLTEGGVSVWLDEGQIKPCGGLPAKILKAAKITELQSLYGTRRSLSQSGTED